MPCQRMDNETMIQWSSSHQRASAVGPRRKVKKFTQTKWAKEWKRDQSILLDITTAIFSRKFAHRIAFHLLVIKFVILLRFLLAICSPYCLPFARHSICHFAGILVSHFTWLNANSLATSLPILLTVWLATLLGIFVIIMLAISFLFLPLQLLYSSSFCLSFLLTVFSFLLLLHLPFHFLFKCTVASL